MTEQPGTETAADLEAVLWRQAGLIFTQHVLSRGHYGARTRRYLAQQPPPDDRAPSLTVPNARCSWDAA